MKKSISHRKIKAAGFTIGFLEGQMKVPRNTFYNFVNGAKPLPAEHLPAAKKVLKKYKINLAV